MCKQISQEKGLETETIISKSQSEMQIDKPLSIISAVLFDGFRVRNGPSRNSAVLYNTTVGTLLNMTGKESNEVISLRGWKKASNKNSDMQIGLLASKVLLAFEKAEKIDAKKYYQFGNEIID